MKYYVEECDLQKFAKLEVVEKGDITELIFKLEPEAPVVPEKITVRWNEPVTETFSFWGPNVGTQRHLAPSWGPRMSCSRLASGAPVHSIISANDKNRLTIAVSDAATPLDIKTGIDELRAEMECRVVFFTLPCAAIDGYEATIRLDYSRRNYCDVLRDVAAWWENGCGMTPMRVPDLAKQPMNSLWYSYHQYLAREKIVAEAKASVPYGMKTVIIDDGWQTADKGGYSHCGDWQPIGLPDIKKTVAEVHDAGMKLILWFSVPFIGIYSENFERFKDKTLYSLFDDTTYTLDPRYPDVREYLVNIYVNAMKEYDLDGMKLDFIDSFCPSDKSQIPDDRRDFVSIDDAVDALMTETKDALMAIKPDVMIEFRQSYIGPAIRKFGNMLRVGDCACDTLSNRRAIIDLRLISGDTAVHSDMLMWNMTDSAESVALQLGSILFGVPQISVRLAEIPENQKETLAYYLKFWIDHRDVLLGGKLYAADPAVTYSSAYAEKDGERITVAYTDPVVKYETEKLIAVNNGAGKYLYFEGAKEKEYRTVDCAGHETARGKFGAEISKIPVPQGGMVFIG